MRRAALRRQLDDEQRRIAKLAERVRYVPQAIERAKAKLERLQAEASEMGILPKLEKAHHAGDMIATEYLKRLGYFR